LFIIGFLSAVAIAFLDTKQRYISESISLLDVKHRLSGLWTEIAIANPCAFRANKTKPGRPALGENSTAKKIKLTLQRRIKSDNK